MYVRELVISYRSRATGVPPPQSLVTPPEAAALLVDLVAEEPVEVFVVLLLTSKQHLLGVHQVSRGGISATTAGAREVFQAALLANAAAIIVAHNHPSGDPKPSPEDRALTKRLTDAGELIGVSVLDHIIVGHDGRYFSFHEAKMPP